MSKGEGPQMQAFEELLAEMLAAHSVERGTMMGFPCMRINGVFFASADHKSGDLIVKLPKERVAMLIEAGEGVPFAPAGRVFKEWVSIPSRDAVQWHYLAEEALAFVVCKQK